MVVVVEIVVMLISHGIVQVTLVDEKEILCVDDLVAINTGQEFVVIKADRSIVIMQSTKQYDSLRDKLEIGSQVSIQKRLHPEG